MCTRRSLLLAFAAVVVFAVSLLVAAQATQAHIVSPPAALPSGTPPPGIDLDVTFISRAPLYHAYCVTYLWSVPNMPGIPALCPGTETEKRWPSPGEVVTFTAHIVNKGTIASPPFAYRWTIDGNAVLSGTLGTLAPSAEITTAYHWVWAHTLSPDGQRLLDEHTVGFVVDPDNVIAETYESNNQLTDRTDAMSFRINITPAMVAAYNVPVSDTLPYSAEDWLQKQIAMMNANFARSIYTATTPAGATLRVRIDVIEVSATYPDDGRAHDGGWFVDADYRHGASAWYDPATDIDWALIHELCHQVSVIDLYVSNIPAANVNVVDPWGWPANFGFDWPNADLMGGGDIAPHTDPNIFSSHTAGGASTHRGYRNGFYGAYQFDIPQQNYLRIVNQLGQPVSGVTVTLYQRNGPPNWLGHITIDNTPEITGVTTADGTLLLPNRSADGGTTTASGHVLHDNPFGVIDIIGIQNRFLVQLGRGEHEEFHWLDITAFNLAYWSGDTLSHTFTITSHVPAAAAPTNPTISTFQVEANRVHLCWQAVPSATNYLIYRAGSPDFRYQPISGSITGTCFDDDAPSSYSGHVYVVTARDGLGRDSGFSHFRWTPILIQPAAAIIRPDGNAVILDPQNGNALIGQDESGRYLQNYGAPYHYLEYARFMALDVNQHLLFNHPGDPYSSRHSVMIYNLQGTPLLEFGETGSGPGQFQNPAGVAAWGPVCTYTGPYTDDAHTLLLAHFDGNTSGTQGETGTANGITFAAGQYNQGVVVDASDTLTYTATGNLTRTQGAVEFWLRPNWNGSDNQNYVFFEAGSLYTWENRLRITKDGANNLRFLLWDGNGAEYGVATNVGHWQAGEWHHIAATWGGGRIVLYVDGQPVSQANNIQPPAVLPPTIFVGVSAWWDFQANGVIDELRISDVPRLGNSLVCNRLLVADSGNHRLQVFDSLGNFVSEFGGPGSGPGQFNHPQGLTVDHDGRVIVVDSGNSRLQVLSFDGEMLSFSRVITADFNSPIGVAVGSLNRLVVADTGHNLIKVLDPAGHLLAQYSAPNDGYNGPFNQPRGVAIDSIGRIIVADTGNRRVVTIKGALLLPRGYLPLIVKNQ